MSKRLQAAREFNDRLRYELVRSAKLSFDDWFDYVLYPLAAGDASRICSELRKQIGRTGGGRERGEGVRLLLRIENRLLHIMGIARKSEPYKGEQK